MVGELEMGNGIMRSDNQIRTWRLNFPKELKVGFGFGFEF